MAGPARVDVVEIHEQAGGEHQGHVHHDEHQEPGQHEEMQRPGGLDAEVPAHPPEAGRKGRGHAQPCHQGERRGDEDGDEVGEDLQAVVSGPAVVDGPVQREVLDEDRRRVRQHVPARGHEAFPPAGREQQGIEDGAVGQPQDVDAEMPPPGQADGVAEPGQADLAREADRILLGRPQRIGRYRLLDAKPVPAGVEWRVQ